MAYSFCRDYFADNEQDTNPCFAIESEPRDLDASPVGAPVVCLHAAAVLAAPAGRPGVLHQTHFGGQERSVQAVQLRLRQERQALPECFPEGGAEGRVSGGRLPVVPLLVWTQTPN